MRKKQLIVLLIVVALINVAGISIASLATASPSQSIDLGHEAIDATPEMLGEDEIAMRKLAVQVGPAVATGASPIGEPATIGETFTITVSDFVYGDYDEEFTVLMDGTHGILLIEKDAYEHYDAGTDEYVFANPNGIWRPEDRISTAQLTYILNEFDTVIYPTDTSIYGELIPRGDEGQKVWILIHNIRDESYYGDYEYYVAGYFSSGENAENNKNMFHIDSYDWDNRIGPGVARPYLYEGVFAHEFEHMIHFDQDPDEPSWVDEGLADLAGYFCGYGHSSGHVQYYFRRHWYTALTFWGGGLEDYGASYLFQLYLFEHFGGAEFTSALVQEQANGIEGIEKTLAAFGYSETFDEIFDAWTIANYIDDTRKSGGKYGYETLDIGTADTNYWTIEYYLNYYEWLYDDIYGWFDVFPYYEAPFEVNTNPDNDWQFYLYGDPMPYTANYFRFNNKKSAELWLDGSDTATVEPHSGSYEWHSGNLAWAWRSFNQTFDIPATGATLNFWTSYDIEVDYDYGYVEVYDRDTGLWTTLEDTTGYTTDELFFAQENSNCPDDQEPSYYNDTDQWHAFNGNSHGYVQVSMDLIDFADHTIDIHFRLWQDGAFTLINMFVDDISIPEIGFFDDVELGEDGWTSTGWVITDGIFDNGFGMVVIDTKGVPTDFWTAYDGLPTEYGNAMTLHSIRTMTVDFATQSGVLRVPAAPKKSGRVQVAIVANHADHIIAQSYSMGAVL